MPAWGWAVVIAAVFALGLALGFVLGDQAAHVAFLSRGQEGKKGTP